MPSDRKTTRQQRPSVPLKVTCGPRRQNDVADKASALLSAQIQTQFILQEAGVVPKKLWNQLHHRREFIRETTYVCVYRHIRLTSCFSAEQQERRDQQNALFTPCGAFNLKLMTCLTHLLP